MDTVELYLTRGKQLFRFETHRQSRPVADSIFRDKEYSLLSLRGWRPATIVDVGANVGAFSVFFAMNFPEARILAYEPVRDNFRLLEKNVRDFPGIEIHPAGLLDRAGRLPIYYGTTNPGECSLYRGMQQQDAPGEEVELRRASDELRARGVEDIGVLKVDTEGAELPILRDLGDWLPRVDYLLVEYHLDADRLALDAMLSGRFLLYGGRVYSPHRGVFKYVRRDILDRHELAREELRREEGKRGRDRGHP